MIATHLYGGLGNQIFQFAAGKALAARVGVELRLDTRYFTRRLPIHQQYGLHHFSIDTAEVDWNRLPAEPDTNILKRLLVPARGTDWKMKKEAALAYDPEFETLPDGTYLQGYWQSERYFRSFAKQIRPCLNIITAPCPENVKTMQEQDGCYSVSMHIRRGDYVTVKKFNSIFGTCDLQYYHKAAKLIAAKTTEDPVFFVFSDDPDWGQENLKLPFKTKFVTHNSADKNYEDMRLMSRCRHHVIANSSFSWWGAWLNPDSEKTVIAPKRWYAESSRRNPDILPPEWTAL